jgi:hypothetical protein
VIKRRHDLRDPDWRAFEAGRDFEMAREFMLSARESRLKGYSREAVCLLVRCARSRHRSYLRWLVKALAVQP